MSKQGGRSGYGKFIASLAVFTAMPILLVFARYLESSSSRFLFLIWNLVLAIIPLLILWFAFYRSKKIGWRRPTQALLLFGWLIFLPNSFYIATDFIHLGTTYEVSVLYDAVMILAFTLVGMVYGYMSIIMLHRRLLQRFSSSLVWSGLAILFLLISFAIYLGRYSRWNSWDLLLRPAGLIFDVSDSIIDPFSHVQTYVTTTIFFILLMSLYWLIWETTRLTGRSTNKR